MPKRFGLRQTIADTLGVGGIMRGLRTIPVLLGVCRDMEELRPTRCCCSTSTRWRCSAGPSPSEHDPHRRALPLRPAHGGASSRTTSACRPTRSTTTSPGINHLAFFLRLEHDGEDLYPALRECRVGRAPEGNRVRYEVLRHFGYFVTESSEHFAEYVPWFIKAARPDLIERFDIPLDEYPRRCEAQIAEWEALRARRSRRGERSRSSAASSTAPTSSARARRASRSPSTATSPTATRAVRSSTTCRPTAASRCRASPARDGIEPQAVGALPRHLAALMQTNVNVQGLTVEAALTGHRDPVHHAAMLDPHTAGELTLEEIRDLVDALLEAHGD